MKSVKGAKKAAKKAGKIATKAMAKGTKTLAAAKKKVVKTVSKAETQSQSRAGRPNQKNIRPERCSHQEAYGKCIGQRKIAQRKQQEGAL